MLAAGLVLIALLIGYTKHLKAQVRYTGFECPMCGSDEVLDFWETDRGKHAQCCDCKVEFYEQKETGK